MIRILTKKLKDHFYRFEEYGGPNQVHAYLICGTEKALMIDGLWLAEGLLAEAEKVLRTEYEDYTPQNRAKKLEMLITHGHEDHAGKGMEEFLEAGCVVYLSEKDWLMLAEKYKDRKPQITFLTEKMCGGFTDSGQLVPGQEDGRMDFGSITVQIVKMPGHTPGSLLVWVPEWNTLFTSDAIGAGVLWMQLPECRPLSEYEMQVRRLLVFLENEKARTGIEVKIYPGHAQQIVADGNGVSEDSLAEDGEQEILTYHYVREVLELTEKIQDNPQIGQTKQIDYPGLEHVRVRSVGERLLYDYCYDEDRAR
ncbi:hydroxyacylglutathione hydrolase [uncultured Clostridium sp.]|uniref:MBL fold metallo-hydrolase n=1 Tax=Muricoprocola aceti TaxID=2981772 RepID=A0ABT2SIV0_9FIRM|nr:MBL fold metallo-hydrolase [Muricoprocola aceti]MCU6724251.1 MBL fold metallo-hydrolase [Muricoprocola aceti]SCH07483.1 hydroxyacylglutathione hydrolase [uncultured Clostridium sp.]